MNSIEDRATTELVRSVLAGNTRSISRAITSVENRNAGSQPLLQALFPHTGRATIVGITGPSGAGKSTLVASLAKSLRKEGKSVAILAVDPTSPYSGGAILGDRIRMQSLSGDDGIFIRSMATRGALGGLAHAAFDAATILDASGRDYILIETVGVGQDEVGIAKLADVTVVVLVPGLGDDIQAFKAGIMEIADIFAINKSDLPGAERVEQDVRAALELASGGDKSQPEIIRTVAIRDEGITELHNAIARFAFESERSGLRAVRRKAMWRERLSEILRDRVFDELSRTVLAQENLESHADSIAARKKDPYSAADKIVEQFHAAVRRSAQENAIHLDHLGVGVKSLAEAVKFYEDALGLTVSGYETIAGERTRVAMLPAGESRIELLEPTEADSPIGKFVSKRGEGLHHICLRVPNLRASIERLKRAGVPLVNDQPQIGAGGHEFVFIHPRGSNGVLIELVQAK